MLGKHERILPIDIQDEMKNSYMDYSMSVIVSRALPDVRDGLKPSQRRILVAMNDLGLSPGKAYRKCAKIAGDTSGNYHPHGEQVVYPTLVRMAQDFALRYLLVDGQGNFGSIDGDGPAAMRYTEARMTHLSMEMLRDLEKNTVDHSPNYDETRMMPDILPSGFPNLLCNGSSGIAVGMATNIPPHNLSEIVSGLLALIDNPDITSQELMEHVKGPDFPTGAIIYGREGIIKAYETGRGQIKVRARANIETLENDRENIVITEIPYMVNKNNLLEKIADLVRSKKIEGIADLRDESDRDGMRIMIEIKRDANSDVILKNLFKLSTLSTTYSINTIALVDNQPKVLPLKMVMSHYINHRHEIVVRRTIFDLEKAEQRAHILEGLKIALDNIDRIIAIIRASSDPETAKESLIKGFKLTDIQAKAILDMRLQRLTGLERKKIDEEYLELIKKIEEYKGILSSRARRMGIIREELIEIDSRMGDERRTDIIDDVDDLTIEDLIAEEDMVVTISHQGYIKRLPIGTYRRQRRGGRGVTGMGTKEEDFVEHLFVASTHSYILFFTDMGKCYWLKVYEIPQVGRAAKGRPIVNILQVEKEENISAFVPVRRFEEGKFIIMASRNGLVKKTDLMAYSRPKKKGIIALKLLEKDSLIQAKLTDGSHDVLIQTKKGKAIRFLEQETRPMGRNTQGVRGIRLDSDDEVVGMITVQRASSTVLVICEAGYGKRSYVEDFRRSHRGGKGVISIRTSERNGNAVAIMEVVDEDEIMIISREGLLIRLPIRDINVIGRATQGVKVINLLEGDSVQSVARVLTQEREDQDLEMEAMGETENEEVTEEGEGVSETEASEE